MMMERVEGNTRRRRGWRLENEDTPCVDTYADYNSDYDRCLIGCCHPWGGRSALYGCGSLGSLGSLGSRGYR